MLRIGLPLSRVRVQSLCRIRNFPFSTGAVDDSSRKRLDVAIVGAPNAGKSQLLNSFTQSKVAAVSRKRHTTRTDVLGARTVGDTQIVFKDTPGFLRLENAKEERLDRDLIATAAAEMQHVDYSLLVVDSVRTLKENYRHALVQLMVGAINSRGRIEEEDDDEISVETKDTTEDVHGKEEKSKFAIVLNKGRWNEAGYVHRFCQMALSWSQLILSSIQWIW
jgi:GTP-binding protein Era